MALIALLLSSGMNPKYAFAPLPFQVLSQQSDIYLVQEKYGSFDRVVKGDNEEVKSDKVIIV
ncbi:hypothetical protein [Peribacillus butanolivorans]|uniref:hypothetical protein n=1 Tax=Peribacillus butanolivorans TaxID=421767 RepID=UPI00366D34FD